MGNIARAGLPVRVWFRVLADGGVGRLPGETVELRVEEPGPRPGPPLELERRNCLCFFCCLNSGCLYGADSRRW